jgi:16S rRNA U1498 N3-methylase RsmE
MVRRIAPRQAPPSPAPSVDKDEQEALAARARMNQMYARAAQQSGNNRPVQITMYMTSW